MFDLSGVNVVSILQVRNIANIFKFSSSDLV